MYLYNAPGISKRDKKRRYVAEELVTFLKEDDALTNPLFRRITERMLHLLNYKGAWNDTGRSPIEKLQGLMTNYFSELKVLLIDHYIGVNADLLEEEIRIQTQPSMDDLHKIVKLSNNIMSFMLTLGIPLKECNYLYERVLRTRGDSFDIKFNSSKIKVNVREQKYTVTLSMENNKLFDMLTSAPVQLKFNGCIYDNFINASNKKITNAVISVDSYSVLSAKVKAESILGDIVRCCGLHAGFR